MGLWRAYRHHLQNAQARTVLRQDSDATTQATRDQAALPSSPQTYTPFAVATPSDDDARLARITELRAIIAVDERMITRLGPRGSSAYQAELTTSLAELEKLES